MELKIKVNLRKILAVLMILNGVLHLFSKEFGMAALFLGVGDLYLEKNK